ncbi:MAG: hypothetical protein ACE3JP_14660 [Ectobacillus sp.]
MRFSSETKTLSLAVQGYQFPQADAKPDYIHPYDANWLNILFTLQEENSTFVQFDPFLTTEEVGKLISWLRSLPNPPYTRIAFTEPSFQMELVDFTTSVFRIRVHLSLELLPPWVQTADSHSIDFLLTTEQIQECINSLHKQLQMYPVR